MVSLSVPNTPARVYEKKRKRKNLILTQALVLPFRSGLCRVFRTARNVLGFYCVSRVGRPITHVTTCSVYLDFFPGILAGLLT